MKKHVVIYALCPVLCALCQPVFAEDEWQFDTENPLFFESPGDILSKTGADYGDSILAVRQQLSVGITRRLALHGAANWQQDFDGPRDGFSHSGFGFAYRVSEFGTIADLFANVKFGGRARTPEYAATVYSVGSKVGRTWSRFTCAATLETSWIFHEIHGMAYIDLTPEVYVSVIDNWSIGANMMLRKATNPNFDGEWVGGKIAKRYGRTIYVGYGDYEFERRDFRWGGRINILF